MICGQRKLISGGKMWLRETGKRFGEKGWSLFSRADFDGVTSVGFGLSWGMLSTSVSSFLFETFGGRPGRTTSFIRTDGTEATMRMAMDRHALGAWTLLEMAADRKDQLLRDNYEAVLEGVSEAQKSRIKQIIIPKTGDTGDATKVTRMIKRLQMQGISVKASSGSFSAEVSDLYDLNNSGRVNFDNGAYVIDFTQPQARLARALLDPTIDERKTKGVGSVVEANALLRCNLEYFPVHLRGWIAMLPQNALK